MRKRLLFALSIFVMIAITIALSYLFFHTKNTEGILTLYGNVDVRLVDIGFRVPGEVERLYFEEGDFVPKGSLVAKLKQNPYDSQVLQAVANVENIFANLKNTEILLERRQLLIDVGGVSREDLDNTFASYQELLASMANAKAALTVALDNLSYTEVFAPTDGILLTRIREPGTIVREADPVVTLSIKSPVWIRAFIDEPDLGLIYYGMPAEITTDLKNGSIYEGKIGFISPMAEFTPKSVETTNLRTDLVYRLRIYVDDADHHLLQGMPVTVKLKPKKLH